jgi:hypothetical protein
MNNRISSRDMVKNAYRLLKQDAYYDKMDLFLRANISEYEANKNQFEKRQAALADVVDALRQENSPTPMAEMAIKAWLRKTEFRLLPKAVDTDSSADESSDGAPRLISNVREAGSYKIKKDGGVQYFFYGPIELYILDTIWCMVVGPEIDRDLDDGCLGNRLEYFDSDEKGASTSRLFKLYHLQYELWRNTAVRRAKELLEQGTSSVLISLDVKQCYYHLSVDWDSVPVPKSRTNHALAVNLTNILGRIHGRYHAIIRDILAKTHGQAALDKPCIPIGLPSSRVLANWLLNPFDQEMRKRLQPAFYGRYVDDMLVTAHSPSPDVVSQGVGSILDDLLINRGLLKASKDGNAYTLCCLPRLVIQGTKLIVHHFDKRHSRALLRESLNKIRHDASEFRFLPVDERGRELDACAYDIIYKGSINKLRSIVGVSENSTELNKYLARRMVEHRLTSEDLNKDIAEQLDRFSRGKNLLDFCVTWERILTLLIIKRKHVKAADFLNRCREAVDRLCASNGKHEEWVEIARKHLKEYLTIALALPLALLDQEEENRLRSKRLLSVIRVHFDKAQTMAVCIRASNLMRHQWVMWPLVNFTAYRGSLVVLDMERLASLDNWSIDAAKEFSPRHIHADERQLFDLLRHMLRPDGREEAFFFEKPESLISDSDEAGADFNWNPDVSDKSLSDLRMPSVTFPSEGLGGKLVVGIANLEVEEKDIAASYEPLRVPNTTWERQCRLFKLLNIAEEEEKCDIVVLPEVSVPYAWLPFMVAHARQAEMALVFGLEHWVSGKTAYNLLVTILPYREKGKYRACRMFIRPKNDYSPRETQELARLDLHRPDSSPGYFLFDWKGVRFTVFNCYELTNIRHRGAFRSKIDLLIGAEWNPDTKYFSNIVESTVRDLWCYMVQVNTSNYGDSRVTAPRKSEEMNAVRVTGGKNTTLLKAEIDFKRFNDIRCKKTSPIDDLYKPPPSGFEHDEIRTRNANLYE